MAGKNTTVNTKDQKGKCKVDKDFDDKDDGMEEDNSEETTAGSQKPEKKKDPPKSWRTLWNEFVTGMLTFCIDSAVKILKQKINHQPTLARIKAYISNFLTPESTDGNIMDVLADFMELDAQCNQYFIKIHVDKFPRDWNYIYNRDTLEKKPSAWPVYVGKVEPTIF